MHYLSTNKTTLIWPGAVARSEVGWLCWGLTSQSTIFQSYRDGAIASWVINQYFRGVKCLAQGHNTAAVGLEPRTSRSGVRHSTTEPPRSPRSEVSSLGMQAAPSSIPMSGTFFRGDLVTKTFLRPFSLFHWFKKSSCQLLAKECALSTGKLA